MKFGQVEDPTGINFSLPKDNPKNVEILQQNPNGLKEICIGSAKLSKTEFKGFYPRGTKDILSYYATQFNSIEFNATFYRMPTAEQVLNWKDKTPPTFKFFPKVTNSISHYRRLNNVTDAVTNFTTAIINFGEQLGMAFLQMPENFKPKDFHKLENFVKNWPIEIPLAIELRNTEWFSDQEIYHKTKLLFLKHNITHILVDTPNRRDMLHMYLTTTTAFVRFVSAYNNVDYQRLDQWIERLSIWKKEGLENLYFFIHQSIEKPAPLLSAYFIEKINEAFGLNIHIPKMLDVKSD